MKLAVLGSGSAGNSTLVSCGSTLVLVDAGLSARQLTIRMRTLGVEPSDLDAILLTHEHMDHTRGLDVFLAKRENLPVYSNSLTREALSHRIKNKISWRIFQSGQDFALGALSIQAFKTPHDAAEPVGFTIMGMNTKLGMLSDVGHITNLIREQLKGSHALHVEANYDPKMLEHDTRRPWPIKQRIASRHGHLSNQQTAELLAEVGCEKLRLVILSHLSSDCNSPELATKQVSEKLFQNHKTKCVDIYCASQKNTSGWLHILAQRSDLGEVPLQENDKFSQSSLL